VTDFLTNLAARAIATPALRPRARLRFEPVPEGEAMPSFAVSSVAREAAQPATIAPQAALKPVAAHEPLEPGLTPRQAAPRREQMTERIIERSIEHDTTTLHRIDTRVEHDTTALHRIDTRVEHDAIVAAPVVPPHRYDEQPPRLAREEREPPIERAPAHPSAAAETLSAPEPRRTDGRMTSEVAQTRAERRATPQQAARRSPPSADQTVHVTIGRVEVRAVTPPAASNRSSRKGSAMTIDDYIAKRNARERR
jgi:hypothetical protein